jgi:hypothetical protein
MQLPIHVRLIVFAGIALAAAVLAVDASAGTRTGPEGLAPAPGVRMVPDGNAANVTPNIPAANLWLCSAPACSGPGEGSLRVVQHAFGVAEGIGAYELAIAFDETVVGAVNPCDLVFGAAGAGAARGPVDELDSSAQNPDCADDSATGPGTCTLSVPLERIVVFGCVTPGLEAGPTGGFALASLLLTPSDSAMQQIEPGVGNGVFTVVTNRWCALANALGEPIAGSVEGGVTPYCRDLAVTVRALEGDFDADCDVDTGDAQAITSRYGALFSGPLYDRRFDMEPTGRDLDIDIKDVQRVYARIGSTCQAPIPQQRPIGPEHPFQD